MSDLNIFSKIRIVLVGTSHPGNIGAAARAMKNMGLSALYLVRPKDFPAPRATWRAANASDLLDNAKVVDILALSSGELARVNTATLLAIRKLMSSISSSRINTLFLDEIISVLDEEGKEKLVEILLGEELNTYLVSHGWTHPLLAKIEVIKEDNISRLE